jgi:hypothetical protein
MRRAARQGRLAVAAMAGALLLAGCGASEKESANEAGADKPNAEAPMEVVQTSAKIDVPKELAALTLADQKQAFPAGAGQTLARDAKSGAVFLAWLRDVPGQAKVDGKDPDGQIVVATSTDDGKTFGEPVVVSTAEQKAFYTATANPAQVVVAPDGKVYVAYTSVAKSEWSEFGASLSHIVRSEDGGKTFSAPVQMITDEREKLEAGIGTSYMNNLYPSKDGDLFYTFLDERDVFAAKKKAKEAGDAEHSGHDKKEEPATQLRITRSTDGGRTWSPSTLVGMPVCGCCSTVITENGKGDLFAGTRSAFLELEGSYDAVRDLVIAKSTDDGATWSGLTKVHNDGFKVSGCPDVSAGLAADSAGRLHAAWYTGTESHPGVYYSRSDDGQTWTKPLALLHGKWAPYADVRLVMDGKDNPWVAFEDRSGDVDQVRVARIDPNSMAVSFAAPVPGRGPAMAVGDGWALLTFESNPANEDDEGATALNSLLARLPSA